MKPEVLSQAEACLRQSRPEAALALLNECCKEPQCSAHAWFLLGVACHRTGQLDEALSAFEQAILADPRSLPARSARGAVLIDLGRFREALQVCRKALHLAPNDPQLLLNLAVACEQAGELAAALERYEQLLRVQPDFATGLLNRGALLLAMGRMDDALTNNQRLVELHPEWDSAQHNLGESLLALTRWAEALAAYDRALAITPAFARALFSKGLALAMLHRFDEAQQAFDQAKASDSQAYAACLRQAASQTGSEAREFPPQVIYLLKQAISQESCDWAGRDEFVADFDQLIRSSLGQAGEIRERALLFRSLALPISAEMRLALAKSVSTHLADSVRAVHPTPFIHRRKEGGRLKVGYVSPNFRTHPNAIVTRSMYGLHDRAAFEVYGYSLRPGDGSELRRDIERGCDHFRELSGCSDIVAAETINADGVDVLIDLAGYTTFSRTEIFALRPAPLQVAFHGFPHSMGASFIQYYIADAVAVPEGSQSLFTESLVYMPDSYYMFNDRQTPPGGRLSRAEAGLPEAAFVFCCFNNHYKIEPAVFDIWMNLLKRLPGSVLWLYQSAPAVVKNLRREAETRGVAANRLVFAEHVPNEIHLSRYRLADLFLDTFIYNAHTTAIEALWAGLPVLTCPGRVMPSRVAASLLTAVGLDEMIAGSPRQYEEMAYALATRRDELERIRARLAGNRPSAPLFDTERQVRNLEQAYQTMWRRHQAGLPPASFRVGKDV